jgi:GH15 family glucan-1,4-alpha-glucosidase
MALRIEDYALIGDCETAGLVGRNGSIDWLCWPRFDSGAVFAALLGNEDNGYWKIATTSPGARVARRYRENTLILETDIETEGGAATLIDFMPLQREGTGHLIRIVRGRAGRLAMRIELAIRFDYGSIVPWVTRESDHSLKAVAGPDMVVLRSDVPLRPDGFKHSADFIVNAGETIAFVLVYARSFENLPRPVSPTEALTNTAEAWLGWASHATGTRRYSSAVLRSLITLKALSYRLTGGVVAAATTSLPEKFGAERNWDYRYCWLRDATFTLLALMNSGFDREAQDWRLWLRRAVAGKPAQVQIMYGLAGERRLDEWEVPWLAGYEASKPVRVGNAAAKQLQLDIFGEVMDVLYQASAKGLISPEQSAWDLQCKLIEHLETVWEQPDEGLWEVRGRRRHFTHSKVMAWVAFDRAVRSAEQFGFAGPAPRWRKIRDQIHDQVCRRGYNVKLGAFVQSFGSTQLDASALLIPLVGFLPASDKRVGSTVDAIGRHLMRDGLVLRYDTRRMRDSVSGREGAFLACSFWYADNLVLLGRCREARNLFERLLSLRNDVGLLAEEFDVLTGRMVGNFPQAFSHVALINTAHNLAHAEKPAEQRSGNPRQSREQASSNRARCYWRRPRVSA